MGERYFEGGNSTTIQSRDPDRIKGRTKRKSTKWWCPLCFPGDPRDSQLDSVSCFCSHELSALPRAAMESGRSTPEQRHWSLIWDLLGAHSVGSAVGGQCGGQGAIRGRGEGRIHFVLGRGS